VQECFGHKEGWYNMKEAENDDPQMGFNETETQILSGDLMRFLTLFGRIIDKTPGDIIGGE
jgi:hypothetical protein